MSIENNGSKSKMVKKFIDRKCAEVGENHLLTIIPDISYDHIVLCFGNPKYEFIGSNKVFGWKVFCSENSEDSVLIMNSSGNDSDIKKNKRWGVIMDKDSDYVSSLNYIEEKIISQNSNDHNFTDGRA